MTQFIKGMGAQNYKFLVLNMAKFIYAHLLENKSIEIMIICNVDAGPDQTAPREPVRSGSQCLLFSIMYVFCFFSRNYFKVNSSCSIFRELRPRLK